MSVAELVPSDSWLIELLDRHGAGIRRRGLHVLREFDPAFLLRREKRLELALERLLRFVFATVPEHCDVYLASVRSTAAVAELGSGSLIVRWQVSGATHDSVRGQAIAIRPLAGAAAFHTGSRAALRLTQAFIRADWSLELSATRSDTEIWARAWPG